MTSLRSGKPIFAGLLLVTSLQVGAAPSLDPRETDLVAWINDHKEAAIGLVERQVNINSGSLNIHGVKEVGVVLRMELDAMGFETRWIDQPRELERGGHLFGKLEGHRGKKILLIGHLDTVFEPGDAFQRFSRDGNVATGPGVEDMKAGNAIIIYALKALQAVGALQGSQVMVAFTGDEESPGQPVSISRKDLIEAGRWADVALGFEAGIDSDGKEWVTVARRSASSWCLEVTGRQAHSSGIFGDRTGAGAIFEASRTLSGFYEQVRGEAYLTFNAGTIMGGTEVEGGCGQAEGRVFGKTNVVPNRVVVRGGIRTISDQQLEQARRKMREIVAQNLPVTTAAITFVDGYPAMPPTEGNRQLGEMLSSINLALGRDAMPVLDPSRRGAADISFVAPYTDGLAGMGAYGKGSHTPAETLELDSLPIAIQRAAILVYRLSREPQD